MPNACQRLCWGLHMLCNAVCHAAAYDAQFPHVSLLMGSPLSPLLSEVMFLKGATASNELKQWIRYQWGRHLLKEYVLQGTTVVVDYSYCQKSKTRNLEPGSSKKLCGDWKISKVIQVVHPTSLRPILTGNKPCNRKQNLRQVLCLPVLTWKTCCKCCGTGLLPWLPQNSLQVLLASGRVLDLSYNIAQRQSHSRANTCSTIEDWCSPLYCPAALPLPSYSALLLVLHIPPCWG